MKGTKRAILLPRGTKESCRERKRPCITCCKSDVAPEVTFSGPKTISSATLPPMQTSILASIFFMYTKGKGERGRGGGEDGRGTRRQGKARQGKARQGKARQGKARQGQAKERKARLRKVKGRLRERSGKVTRTFREGYEKVRGRLREGQGEVKRREGTRQNRD